MAKRTYLHPIQNHTQTSNMLLLVVQLYRHREWLKRTGTVVAAMVFLSGNVLEYLYNPSLDPVCTATLRCLRSTILGVGEAMLYTSASVSLHWCIRNIKLEMVSVFQYSRTFVALLPEASQYNFVPPVQSGRAHPCLARSVPFFADDRLVHILLRCFPS